MRLIVIKSLSFVLITFSNFAVAKDFEFKIPIIQQNSGNYYIAGALEHDDQVEFLVDTGAGMVTLTEKNLQVIHREDYKEA